MASPSHTVHNAGNATLPSSDSGDASRSNDGEERLVSIAQEAIARDLEENSVGAAPGEPEDGPALSRTSTNDRMLGSHSLTSRQRQPSFVASAPRPFLGLQPEAETIVPPEQDIKAVIEEERALLQDNNRLADPKSGNPSDPTETTRLLTSTDPEGGYGGVPDAQNVDKAWEDAVLAGQIKTTWQRELQVIGANSARLIVTFLLQVSLIFTTTFIAGHLGKTEMAATSLGGMTAVITGYSVYYGLVTSLDTMCAQAYGSGRKQLVGLYLQRMVFFLWTCTIPIAVVWTFSPQILALIIPEKEVAELTGRYLRVLIFGAPGFACFESTKRFVQAQGRFNATLCVLIVVAPLNVLMQYTFVFRFGWGFIGCPTSVAIVHNLMPLLLILYIRFVGGKECWPGFTWKAFHNWGPMVRLALPGFVMLFAEILAFEVVTFAAAHISATHLAANAILQSLSVLAFQLPFPLSIAGSTRVANLIGAGLPEAAKITGKVMFVLGFIVGAFNLVVLGLLRNQIPRLYTDERDVALLAAAALPVNAAFQLVDALAAQCNGLLRGLGRQRVGGYICLLAFYVVGIPTSMATAFGLKWDLFGLWCGPAVALAVQLVLEATYIRKTSWQKASDEAASRNAVD